VPSPWTDQDIGSPAIPGLGQYSSGTFTVAGSGTGISGTTDAFHFVSQTLSGDGTIVARLASEFNIVGTAKAGVIIRDGNGAGSTYAFMGLSGSSLQFQYRLSSGGTASASSGGSVGTPTWFKLVRSGSSFTGYASADGSTWVQQGSVQTISMATPIVGLAISSENTGQVTTATLDNVVVSTTSDFDMTAVPSTVTVAPGASVSYPKILVNALNTFNGTVNLSVGSLPTGVTASLSTTSITGSGSSVLTLTTGSSTPAGSYTITVTGVSGSTRTASVALTVAAAGTGLPPPWMNQDIGAGGTGTGSSYNSGTFVVSGIGCCLWNSIDSFQFAYQILTGDGTIIARVASEYYVTGSAKAGVMIRETLAAGSTNAFMGVSGGSLQFQYRSSTFGSTNSSSGSAVLTPIWSKLVRSGNTVTGYTSPDGSNWVQQGSTQTIAMASTVYVGLAVTSETSSQVTTALFDNVVLPGSSADFYLTASPSFIGAEPGAAASLRLDVDAVNGFNGTVSLSVSGLPTGATASFSPASITSSGSSVLTITNGPSTPIGNYPIMITGLSGSLTHTVSLTLSVTTSPPRDGLIPTLGPRVPGQALRMATAPSP
jgi:hypothetical protein